MSLITLEGIEKIQEKLTAPEGSYDLLILGAGDVEESKNTGRPMIKARIGFAGDATLQAFTHYLTFPMDGDDADKAENMLRGVKRFLTAFNVDIDGGFESDDLINAEAKGIKVVQETVTEDKEGAPLADPFTLNRMILPKFEQADAA